MVGHQVWELVKQVFLYEVVDALDVRVLQLVLDKEINRENFLVGEQRFRIIAIFLTMAFETLFVHIADIQIDSEKSCRFVLKNHNWKNRGIFTLS